MPPIRLIRLGPRALDELRNDPGAFERAHHVALGNQTGRVADLAEHCAEQLRLRGVPPEWFAHLVVDGPTGRAIGTCGFKGPPDADGVVEIAYHTFPAFERQGYATEMARALRDLASADPDVQLVRAHTLRERNTSVRILETLGFDFRGEVIEPGDGPVWRWEAIPRRV
ncbi:MAG: GNAT family N-acetyltransferase [Gemmatimonadales bacterium]